MKIKEMEKILLDHNISLEDVSLACNAIKCESLRAYRVIESFAAKEKCFPSVIVTYPPIAHSLEFDNMGRLILKESRYNLTTYEYGDGYVRMENSHGEWWEDIFENGIHVQHKSSDESANWLIRKLRKNYRTKDGYLMIHTFGHKSIPTKIIEYSEDGLEIGFKENDVRKNRLLEAIVNADHMNEFMKDDPNLLKLIEFMKEYNETLSKSMKHVKLSYEDICREANIVLKRWILKGEENE